MISRVFHENTFSKEKVVHTLTCPSGGYISQIQKLFLFGQVEGVEPLSEKLRTFTL